MTTQEHFGTSSSFGTTHINPNPIPFVVDQASHHFFSFLSSCVRVRGGVGGARYPTSLYVQIFQPRLAPRASTHPPRPGSPLSRLSRDADRRQVPRSLPLRKGKPPFRGRQMDALPKGHPSHRPSSRDCANLVCSVMPMDRSTAHP